MCKRIAPTCIGIPVSYFDGLFFGESAQLSSLVAIAALSRSAHTLSSPATFVLYISDKHRISREYCLASLQEGNGLNDLEQTAHRHRNTVAVRRQFVGLQIVIFAGPHPFQATDTDCWSQLFTSCPSRMLLLSIKGLSRASSFERRRSCHKESTPTPTHKSFDEPCRLMSHKQHHIAGLRLCPVTKFVYFVALLLGIAAKSGQVYITMMYQICTVYCLPSPNRDPDS